MKRNILIIALAVFILGAGFVLRAEFDELSSTLEETKLENVSLKAEINLASSDLAQA